MRLGVKKMYIWIQYLFRRLREICISYTHTVYAEPVLYAIAFFESFIFPIPPDILLLPMVFARTSYAFRYAFGATMASVLGGAIGYAIGMFFFSSIGNWIIEVYSLHSVYETARLWFEQYGVLTMLVAGITPIPYKLATILAGMFVFNPMLFIVSSLIGRGMRFFAIAFLPYIAHIPFVKKIQKNIGILTLFVIILSVSALFIYTSLTGR